MISVLTSCLVPALVRLSQSATARRDTHAFRTEKGCRRRQRASVESELRKELLKIVFYYSAYPTQQKYVKLHSLPPSKCTSSPTWFLQTTKFYSSRSRRQLRLHSSGASLETQKNVAPIVSTRLEEDTSFLNLSTSNNYRREPGRAKGPNF